MGGTAGPPISQGFRTAGTVPADRATFDLLRLPVMGALLRWRHARTAVQGTTLLLAALVLFDGFLGPQLAPKNLAGVLPWVHWRGLVVLALLVAGNFFCFACPFMLPRRLAKRLLPARRTWPRRLQNKWLAAALLVVFFWAYEQFDLWASPLLTAWVTAAYFAAAFVVDGFFRGAAFCKYLCPIGQFHFVNSLASPLEVRVRDPLVCTSCATRDCIRGRDGLPGCELWLFQPLKRGNMDCTFCLDCVRACPHANVGILPRTPTAEIWTDPRRSGVGRLGARPDVAALALVLVFAAFANAFGMVRPVYAVERYLAGLLGTTSEIPVLLVLFGASLVLLPAALVAAAAWASRILSGTNEPLLAIATRYCYALVPLGFGMWLAHYGFHFLTGALTIVPVLQSFLTDLGLPFLGEPRWDLAGFGLPGWVELAVLELGLELGLTGTLVACWRIAAGQTADPRATRRAFAPWATLAVALFAAGLWLLTQPMEMRGTMLM
ncbi:MAG: FesM [Clostridia bacterium]|nr:FesM [Clostridia bacterium]